jgi:hypothetical protein
MKLTNKIQTALIKHVRGHAYDIIIPNFYYFGYEMDLFKLSSSGFISEYEIKISRADFFNDFKKGKTTFNFRNENWRDTVIVAKHDAIKSNRFWFVVPAGLVETKEVPKHAGLLAFNKYGGLEVIKNAPLINKAKPEVDYKLLCRSLSFRELTIKQKFESLKNKHNGVRRVVK